MAAPTPAPVNMEKRREDLRRKYSAKGALIEGAEFKPEDYPVTFSVSLEGREGTGKTAFIALTAPTPLVLINFGDRSAIPFLYDMTPERREQVRIYDIQAPTSDGWDFKSGVASLMEMSEIIAAEGPFMRGGTFGFDGGSAWWSVMQQVFVEPKQQRRASEGKKQVGGVDYEEANNRVKGVMSYLKGLGCFLMMTHQLKQDWDANGPIPGRYSARRNREVPGMMEVVVRLMKVCATEGCGAPECEKPDHVGRKHKARLEKLAGNTGLEGMWVDSLDFPMLYSFQTGKQFPGKIVGYEGKV